MNNQVIYSISSLIIALSFGYYLIIYVPRRDEKVQIITVQQQKATELKRECTKEIEDKFESVDSIVKSDPSITSAQAQSIARRAGITDENNFVVDKYILIENCIDGRSYLKI